jgi:HisJ family histidinol phosphate phosphatase
VLDYHLHLWPHGERDTDVTVEQLAAYCRRAGAAGITEIAVTEHLFRFVQADALLGRFWDADPDPALRRSMAAYWGEHARADLDAYVHSVLEAKGAGLPIALGLEVDYYPGRMDDVADLLEGYPFDVLLGSVHWLGAWRFDDLEDAASLAEWRRRGVDETWVAYTEALEELAASGACDVLAHPDLIKVAGRRSSAPDELYDRMAEAAASSGMAAEVSSAGWRKPVGEAYPAPALLARFRARGVPITTASDAHGLPDVAHRSDEIRQLLTAAGYDSLCAFRKRQPRLIPVTPSAATRSTGQGGVAGVPVPTHRQGDGATGNGAGGDGAGGDGGGGVGGGMSPATSGAARAAVAVGGPGGPGATAEGGEATELPMEVATPADVARRHTRLETSPLGHLQRLMGSWGMLADLCFGDLVLFVPVAAALDEGSRFVVLGQMRPSTGQTLHQEDLVGRLVDDAERPLLGRAWRLGEMVEGELVTTRGERARMQCIPVRWEGDLIAVMTRESPLTVGRRPGLLEREYVELFDRFARMIADGLFPFSSDEAAVTEESPRVGDGVVVLDEGGRVSYGSPNAINALHRMGVFSNVDGMRFGELGVEETAVQRAFATRLPVIEEVERRPDVIVLVRCIPLLSMGELTGAVVLLRDVTDLRRRDRLLVSKDATIREIHHRVKNNLQTISSLLRLQGRRLPPGEGRTALRESERRIRSIAIVHEILSREAGDQVPFDEIVRSLVRMTEDAVVSGRPIKLCVEGDAGDLSADLATPLAVVLAELLQNAIEHAFEGGEPGDRPDAAAGRHGDGAGRVDLVLGNDGRELLVQVRDNGQGLPDGFSIDNSTSLGLSIVRDLVRSQLNGNIVMRRDGGTVVELRIPVVATEDEAAGEIV